MAWVDRPQGLLVSYRLVAATAWDPMVRILAMAAASIATVAVGAAAWAVAGRRAAVIAAGLFAVVSPAPYLEGYTANGELLATAFTSTAVAAAAWWLVRGDRRLLFVAGVAAAIGPLMKQSAVDGLVVVTVVVAVEAVLRRRRFCTGPTPGRGGSGPTPGRGGRDVAVFLGGVCIPLALALAHATATGLGDWWYAMAGHRTQTDSLIHGPFSRRFELFRDSLGPFARSLGLLLPAVALGVVAARRGRRLALPLTWLLATAAGFAVGGLYHPHYWMQLVAPITLLAAIGLDALMERTAASRSALTRTAGVGMALVVALATLVLAAPAYLASGGVEVSKLTLDDRRVQVAQPIGDYVEGITDPTDRVAVLWANAAIYWYADRTPAFRYLWLGPLSQIQGAAAAARAVITGPDPPAVVVVSTKLDELDPDDEVAVALSRRYRLALRFGPYPVYQLRSHGLPPTSAVA